MPIRSSYLLPFKINLIGIYGHAGSGKDSVASYLYSTFVDTYGEHFADPLKAAMSQAFGIPFQDFYDREAKEVNNPFWGVSPRMIAQFAGTELFRDQIWKLLPADSQDFWVRRMFGKLSGLQRHPDVDGEYVEGDTVVIPDVRYQNEYDFIIDNGGIIIHLERPGADGSVGISNHRSEAGITNLHCEERTYSYLNNSTLEDLYEKVHAAVLANFSLTPYSIEL